MNSTVNDTTIAEPKAPIPYTKEYFIAKFEAIHEDHWCVGVIQDKYGARCARGHCFKTVNSYEDFRLCALFQPKEDYFAGFFGERLVPVIIALINNGQDSRYQQPTPKQRVLAALRDLP